MVAISAVVFDLDGTLVDSGWDIARAANATLRAHGREELDPRTVMGFVGDGAPKLVARIFGLPDGAPELPTYLQTYLEYYAAHPCEATELMPGALEALKALSTWPLAVCTNKPRGICDLVLRKLAIQSFFTAVVGGGDVAHRKPHPEPLLLIARTLRVTPASLTVVGDGPQDIVCGRAVGARTVGIEGGLSERSCLLLARPDRVLESLAELPALVREWSLAE